MTFRVRKVESTRDRKEFLKFPYAHYKGSRFWVPPLRMDQKAVLDPSKNPFFEHGSIDLFLAEDIASGKIIGTIAAIVNGEHLKKHNDNVGFFGFFECIENVEVARALFSTVASQLLSQGLTKMRGPCNPSMNDISGMLVNGFDKMPSIMMPYNKTYYPDFLESVGLKKAMTMWAYFIIQDPDGLKRLQKGLGLIKRRYPELSLRKVDMNRFYEDAKIILELYNDAWENNWGHVPMTDAEFMHLAKSMKQIVDPRVVYIMELAGEPIGFSISLPNINPVLKKVKDGRLFPLGLLKLLVLPKLKPIDTLRTILMGIKKEHQGKGWDTLLNATIMVEGPEIGYYGSELSWVLESNPRMIQAAEKSGAKVDKEYAMFEHISIKDLVITNESETT